MPTAGKAPTLDWVLSWGLLCVVTWPSLVVLYLLLNALSFALAASIVKVVLIVPTIQMFLHLLGSYYPFAPRWLEPAFHRWRVARYFAGPHSKSRAVEAVASARQYRPLALPAPGSVQVFDYRPSKAAARTTKGSESLKVVTWNLEFGYLLGPIVAKLRELDADVICLQEVDVHDDPTAQVSVDVAREIARALGLCGVWAGHHAYEDRGIWGCAVLTKLSMAPVTPCFLELEHFEFYPRGAVMVELQCPAVTKHRSGDDRIRVISMHTEVCCAPEVRAAQLAKVCAHTFVADAGDIPTLIAGDMNTLGGHRILRLSPIHHLVHPPWEKRMLDGWLTRPHPKTEAAWWRDEVLPSSAPGFTPTREASPANRESGVLTATLGFSWPISVVEKLDWVLLRGLKHAGDSGEQVGTGNESDHHFVAVELVAA